jgi:hypothetical protein
MTKKEFLKQTGLTEDQFSGKVKIEGYLYLSGLTSIPQGFNPTVGGSLDLRGLTSIPQGFNPTVGGYLYLSGLTSIPQGFNPTVGGDLYLSGERRYIGKTVDIKPIPKIPKQLITWDNGKYVMADGIFTEVINKKGNVYKVKRLLTQKEFYLVTDGKGLFSHGDTLKEANDDLHFKAISEKLKKQPIKPDTIITMAYYRAVTGACREGCKQWMKQNNLEVESIKAKDLLAHLKKTNAYGYERFKQLYNA